METCSYIQVESNAIVIKNLSRRSFVRQLLASSVVWMCFFVYGLSMGSPTVVIPQIRREANSTDAVSDTMASWLSAIFGYGSIPWVVIIPIATAYFGRKIPLIIICMNTLVAVLVFYLSNTVTQILISEAMESIIGAAASSILIMIITEYTSPQYRGIFLTFKSATMYWGIWVSNAIGSFVHWKNIGVVKLVCSIYPIVVVFFIPESPYWLASKGKFEKCAESHRFLKGEHSEIELKSLIIMHRDYLTAKTAKALSLTRARSLIMNKEFYKPTLLGMLLFTLYYFSGKLAYTFYSLDIIKKITSSEKTAYTGMLILDGVTVFSMYFGSALSKCLQRRTLLLASSSIGVIFLFILSLYVYSIKVSYVVENHIVSLLLLMCYSSCISCGPMLLAPAISAEILPLKCRSLFVCIIGVFDRFLMGVTVQLLPYIIHKFGLEVAFFFFGLSSTVCVALLYKYLPETKDKTLQDIVNIWVGSEVEMKNEAIALKSNDITY